MLEKEIADAVYNATQGALQIAAEASGHQIRAVLSGYFLPGKGWIHDAAVVMPDGHPMPTPKQLLDMAVAAAEALEMWIDAIRDGSLRLDPHHVAPSQ